MTITLIIYGSPVAQGRPRFTTVGGHARAFDPLKSKNFKQYVRLVASKNKPDKLLEGPLQMEVKVYKETLKSFSKKKKEQAEAGIIRPITKPDVDNYVKGIKDALKSVIWHDDSQVVDLHISKYYSMNPRVEVIINELDESGDSSGTGDNSRSKKKLDES